MPGHGTCPTGTCLGVTCLLTVYVIPGEELQLLPISKGVFYSFHMCVYYTWNHRGVYYSRKILISTVVYIIPGGKKQPGCTPSEFRKNLLKSQLRSQGCLLFLEEEKTGVSFVPGQYCASANCVLYSWKILIVPNF